MRLITTLSTIPGILRNRMKWACWVREVFHLFITLRSSGVWQLCSIINVTEETVAAWAGTDFAYLVIQFFPWEISHIMNHVANSLYRKPAQEITQHPK